MNQSNSTQVVDLSDLFVTKDEALDLLGDLLGDSPTETSLFGDKPIKLTKPRPQWHADGAVIVTNFCSCRTCGAKQVNLNPQVLISMSYIDHEGRVLKSVKTSDYNLLLEVKGGPYEGKKTAPKEIDLDALVLDVVEEVIKIEDVDFCSSCLVQSAEPTMTLALLKKVLHNQQLTKQRKQDNDTSSNKEFKNRLHLERAERAEKELMDLIETLDKDL